MGRGAEGGEGGGVEKRKRQVFAYSRQAIIKNVNDAEISDNSFWVLLLVCLFSCLRQISVHFIK